MIAVMLVGAVAVTTAPASAQGGIVCTTIQPSAANGKDAYIKEDKQDERRGGDTELRVKTEDNKLNRALLQFDLSSIPSGVSVTSAMLSLYVKDASGGAVTINARGLTASWNEAEVTWKARDKAANLLWSTAGGSFGAIVSSTSVNDTKDVWRSWNVASLVSGWLTGPATNFGVILESPVTNPKTEKKFKSSDDGTASQRPKLEVCYAPANTLSLTPNNAGTGAPGQTKSYGHTITTGNYTSVINLSASSNRGYTTRIYSDANGNGVVDGGDAQISATPSLGPNSTYNIVVQVDIPLAAAVGAEDTTTVTATAAANSASATAADMTTVSGSLVVQPNNASQALPGATVFYGHSIINNNGSQICVNVTASASLGWQVLLWEDLNGNGVHEVSNPNEPALSNPVCVNPGTPYRLVAEVQAPANAAFGAVNTTVISAADPVSGNVRDSATDVTTVIGNDPPVIDGKYDDAYRYSPNATEVCYNYNGVLFGKLATWYAPAGNSVYFILAIDKDFVDNTYGTNAVGWIVKNHNFSDLVGSDHAQFYGFDANGAKVLDFKVDYISTKSGTPSGYASLGVTGGEGRMNTGSAASITAAATSLQYSLNNTGYCSGGNCSGLGVNLLVNSPPTNILYTPTAPYQNWIYDVIYEVQVASSAFGGAGFGSMDVPYIHASPSKLGTNTIIAEPGVCPGEIGDLVWNDTNANGVYDAGEPGINNVQVKLYKDNGDSVYNPANDTLIGTKTTAGGGLYLFQDLTPGDYFVDVVDATVPAGLSITTFNDPTPIINLDAGESYLLADFGYASGAIIGDFVWVDQNQNGIQDPGEPGLANVTVNLYDGSNNLLATTTTDVNGLYRFTNRQTGQYQVGFVKPANYVFTTPDAPGSNDSNDSDANTTTGRSPVFTLTTPTSNLTIDAGMFIPTPPANAVIGDYAWNDLNGDGIQDFGEPGLPNVTVALFNSSNVQVGASKTTNASGYYSFTVSPAPGDYYVRFTAPGGFVFTQQNAGFDDSLDSDADPVTGNTPLTNLFAGEIDLSWDAGFYQPASLGDLVWLDSNGNGIQDPGENQVISNTVVNLYSGLGVFLQTDTTDANGIYGFTNLAPGSYQLEFVLPSPYILTVQNAGGNDALDSDPNLATGFTGLIVLAAGQNDLTWDAGGYAPGVIGDTVYYDDNRNGTQDAGVEDGIADVVVRLYTDDGGSCNKLVGIQITNDEGKYLFENLPAGHYCVLVPETVAENPFLTGLERVVSLNPHEVNLASSQTYLDADFGYAGFGTIQGVVFFDTNQNGVQDINEPGIPNVQVCLFSDTNGDGTPDTQLACTTTASDGGYVFVHRVPGNYGMGSGTPSGLTPTTSTFITTTLVVQQGSGSSTDNDFGNVSVPDYSITKTLLTPSPVRPGQQVQYHIVIQNTGQGWILQMPLVDTYQTQYLLYQNATPASVDNNNDGQINWTDLTTTFGQDLAPGAKFTVTVNFLAVADTSNAPGGQTINVATGQGGQVDPDGPGGPLGPLQTVGVKSANSPVQIFSPTAVLGSASAERSGDQVIVRWTTLNESQVVGFVLWRSLDGGDFAKVEGAQLAPQKAGMPDGANYSFTDTAMTGGSLFYRIEVLMNDGRSEVLEVEAVNNARLFLPVINR
jgi:hypothetical protein